MGPINYSFLSAISARDTVVNLHFAIPHQNDGGRDDVQVLWDSESLHNTFYSNDQRHHVDGRLRRLNDRCGLRQRHRPRHARLHRQRQLDVPRNVGKTFTATSSTASAQCVTTYYFPSSTNRTATFQPIQGGDTIGTTRKS